MVLGCGRVEVGSLGTLMSGSGDLMVEQMFVVEIGSNKVVVELRYSRLRDRWKCFFGCRNTSGS